MQNVNPEELKYWFEFCAIVLGVFLALATVFVQVSKAIERLLNYLEQRRRRDGTKHLLIIPDPSEMAKFSHKKDLPVLLGTTN